MRGSDLSPAPRKLDLLYSLRTSCSKPAFGTVLENENVSIEPLSGPDPKGLFCVAGCLASVIPACHQSMLHNDDELF